MDRSKIRVLIVEDDPTTGKALFEALKRRGFECKLVRTPDEAIQAIKMEEFSAAVLDCMLPKMNGIELGIKLKSLSPIELVTILMSGIFKDRNFSKDAIYKVNASGFLVKPFSMDTLFEILDDAFGDRLNGGKEGWLALYSRRELEMEDVQIAIDRYPNVHGFHLPWIYSMLMQTKYTGHLNILGSKGDLSSVTFNNGQIIQMQLQDKSSYFGVLLVEKGFATPEDVDRLLSEKSTRRLGERLVDALAISPHAVRVVLQDQMKIRLSKTIRNENMEIHLVPEATPTTDEPVLGWRDFLNIAEDWMTSKLTPGWLKLFYSEWMDFSIQNLALPLAGKSANEGTLIDLLKNHAHPEEFYKNLHLQLLQRASILNYTKIENINFEFQAQRLRTIVHEMKNKNHFEVLGLTTKAAAREITRSYHDLAKTFHPDKLPPEAPDEIETLCHEIFTRITLAHDTLKQTSGREQYLKKLEHGLTEEVFLADSLLEQGRILIEQSRFQDGLKVLEDLIAIKSAPPEARLYWLWARIKLGANPQEMHRQLSTIAPENRHSAAFFMVKGLFYRTVNNREKAERYFQNAISIEPTMDAAKRELEHLKKLPPIRPSMGEEITQIVGLIFGKRKRG